MVSKNGILHYDVAEVTFYFPQGHVCCELCPLLETYSRKQCRRTGEYLLDTKTTGFDCPLRIKKEEDDNGNPCDDPG